MGILGVLLPCQSFLKRALFLFLFVGLLTSFLFNVGEVYTYSEYYKRAFFYFSDEITTVVALGWLIFIVKRELKLAMLMAIAVLLSGGKISIILIAITFLLCFLRFDFFKSKKIFLIFICSVFLGVLGYVSSINLAKYIDSKGLTLRPILSQYFPDEDVDKMLKISGKDACKDTLTCIISNSKSALRERYFTSLAGIWMISRGGFKGENYPNTPDKFADLMMKNNPFDINNRYGLTYEKWKRLGGVQSPFIDFGAGYGPWMLCFLLLCFGAVAYCAILNIKAAEDSIILVFSLYFLVILTLNQTQSWLKSGSIVLIMMGYLSGHILISWYKRTKPLNKFAPISRA